MGLYHYAGCGAREVRVVWYQVLMLKLSVLHTYTMYIIIYTHTHIYIYTYIYICDECQCLELRNDANEEMGLYGSHGQ